MENKNITKFFELIILISFLIFLALYISQSTGYYDYRNSKKTALTTNQIKQFEKDIHQGKKVDLNKYIKMNNKNYQNNVSRAGLTISSTTEKCMRKIVAGSFKFLGNLVGGE
jgi:hypothetical protein